jgi:hypothetical protein
MGILWNPGVGASGGGGVAVLVHGILVLLLRQISEMAWGASLENTEQPQLSSFGQTSKRKYI